MLKDFLGHPSVQMKSATYNRPASVASPEGRSLGLELSMVVHWTLCSFKVLWQNRGAGPVVGVQACLNKAKWTDEGTASPETSSGGWRRAVVQGLGWEMVGWLGNRQALLLKLILWCCSKSVLCCLLSGGFVTLCHQTFSCLAVAGQPFSWGVGWVVVLCTESKPSQVLVWSLTCWWRCTVLLSLHGIFTRPPPLACCNFLSCHRFILFFVPLDTWSRPDNFINFKDGEQCALFLLCAVCWHPEYHKKVTIRHFFFSKFLTRLFKNCCASWVL